MSLPVAAVPQVVRISEVSETTVNWKTLVHVLESHRVRVVQMNGTSKAFRRFEFGDSQGITVAAVVYDDDISHVDGLLLPFKKYYISAVELCEILESTPPDAEAQALQKISISNAEVRAAAERFQPDGLKLQWIISTKTVVEEIDEADSSVLPFHFDFTAYKDLPLYADMKYETIGLPEMKKALRGFFRITCMLNKVLSYFTNHTRKLFLSLMLYQRKRFHGLRHRFLSSTLFKNIITWIA
ncbi:uncharacterized protein LOC113764642 [Coffea eugenioides]|uniref:Uncharacterized protein isoform X2 n=1 Tax=Coffea arabica TaxID=13443 RepID=A0ABM4WS76_COFAR|nr:uncharacterized protein LOC113764642 [Coffea eugenioides]XP_027164410.1 uncharacterized protein LOC113764642 [Coffea eugenioides]XP_027164412.1 uncharacterized protein LOC113764642 [Coffea eugenioides]